jgi:hypothetical protein
MERANNDVRDARCPASNPQELIEPMTLFGPSASCAQSSRAIDVCRPRRLGRRLGLLSESPQAGDKKPNTRRWAIFRGIRGNPLLLTPTRVLGRLRLLS